MKIFNNVDTKWYKLLSINKNETKWYTKNQN